MAHVETPQELDDLIRRLCERVASLHGFELQAAIIELSNVIWLRNHSDTSYQRQDRNGVRYSLAK